MGRKSINKDAGEVDLMSQAAWLWLKALGTPMRPPAEMEQLFAIKPDKTKDKTLLDHLRDAVIQEDVQKSQRDLLSAYLGSKKGASGRKSDSATPGTHKGESKPKVKPHVEEKDPMDAIPSVEQLYTRFEGLHEILSSETPLYAVRAMPYHTSWLYQRLRAEGGLGPVFAMRLAKKRSALQTYMTEAKPKTEAIEQVLEIYRQCQESYDEYLTQQTDEEITDLLADGDTDVNNCGWKCAQYSEDDIANEAVDEHCLEEDEEEVDELESQGALMPGSPVRRSQSANAPIKELKTSTKTIVPSADAMDVENR